MFQLTKNEKDGVVAICDHLQKLKYSYQLPYVFTEHGVVMLSSILKSERAVKMSIYIVRAFIKLRELQITHKDIALKINELEKKQSEQGEHIQNIHHALVKLINPSDKIGFKSD